MFKRLQSHPAATKQKFSFSFDGHLIDATDGDTVASALLLNNIVSFGQRGSINKGPHCMMGACYECLVEINGQSVQACMTKATEGLQVMPLNVCNTDSAAPVDNQHIPGNTGT